MSREIHETSPSERSLGAFVESVPELCDSSGEVLSTKRVSSLLAMCVGSAPFKIAQYGFGKPQVGSEETLDLTREEGIARSIELGEAIELLSAYRFARALLARWEDVALPERRLWLIWAALVIANDAIVLDTLALISRHGRFRDAIVRALKALGSDLACAVLAGENATRWAGDVAIEHVVERRAKVEGLAIDVWHDVHAPRCTLDGSGRSAIRCGDRTFYIALDDTLSPILEDEAGKKLAGIPGELESIHPNEIERAGLRWELTRAQLELVIPYQSERMERAMLDARKWPIDAWNAYFLEHPVMRLVATHLVWAVFPRDDTQAIASFRVDPDGTLADIEDELFTFDEHHARVGVMHAAHLSEEEVARWANIMGDYEVFALFEQLGRAAFRARDFPTRIDAIALKSFDAREHPITWLTWSGWKQKKRGRRATFRKTFAGYTAELLATSPLRGQHEWVSRGVSFYKKGSSRAIKTARKIEPVSFSEAMRALQRLL